MGRAFDGRAGMCLAAASKASMRCAPGAGHWSTKDQQEKAEETEDIGTLRSLRFLLFKPTLSEVFASRGQGSQPSSAMARVPRRIARWMTSWRGMRILYVKPTTERMSWLTSLRLRAAIRRLFARIEQAIPTFTYPRVIRRVGKSPPRYCNE
jgi:hypothetical protein